jgi:hypothetical protein
VVYSWKKLVERKTKAVQHIIVHQDPQAFQQAVALNWSKAMYERAFGQGTPINSVRELCDGQFNNINLLELANHGFVVLRVAPSPAELSKQNDRFFSAGFAYKNV